MGSPKGPVLVGVSQNLCLRTPLVPALLVQLHNKQYDLEREKLAAPGCWFR